MSRGRIILFGGTSEGRELAEYAAEQQVRLLVSVASEYGEMLLPENEFVQVRQGRLDEAAMEKLLCEEKPELVLDATHPYAQVVTAQIRKLCKKLGIPCERVVREALNVETAAETVMHQGGFVSGKQGSGERITGKFDGRETAADGEGKNIYHVKGVEYAIPLLLGDERPVLLTTGSKELEVYAAVPELQSRLYARVLPDSGVLKKCEELGIRGKQIIAMQGSFSEEMNCAMMQNLHAGWLVTKESGGRGGYEEKLRAAERCGVSVIVIDRPSAEEGITVEEAKRQMLNVQVEGRADSAMECHTEGQTKREICLHLIGMGMGGGRQLTLEAADALKQCEVVFGARRMLADVQTWIRDAKQYALYLPDQILNQLSQSEQQTQPEPLVRNVAVVYSGDTGFYSGAESLMKALAEYSEGLRGRVQVKIYPGISSVSCLAARMQTSWDHLYLASAHGRACDAVALLREHKRIFLLLGGEEHVDTLCRKLCAAGYDHAKVTAGIRMGYPEEQLLVREAWEMTDWKEETLAAVVVEE